MRHILYILLFLSLPAHGQRILCNGWKFAGGGGGSNPPTTNLWARWKATNGVTTVAGSEVSVWTDMQNSRTLQPPGSANRPSISTDRIVFGTDDQMNLTSAIGGLSLPFTVYAVVTHTNNPGTFFLSFIGNPIWDYINSSDNLTIEGMSSVSTGGSITSGTKTLVRFVNTTSTCTLQINSTTATTGNPGLSGSISDFAIGYIFTDGAASAMAVEEILIYNGSVTDADVKTYITNTYGISL